MASRIIAIIIKSTLAAAKNGRRVILFFRSRQETHWNSVEYENSYA